MDQIEGLYPVRDITDFRDMLDQSVARFGDERGAREGTVVSARIFPDIAELNERVPSYKAIHDFHIRNTEFIKTTTAKIKRYANLDEPEEKGEDNDAPKG